MTMGIGEIVEWTKSKLVEFAGEGVAVTRSKTVDAPTIGTAAIPLLDLFENEKEYRVVVDAPGATALNTHLTWNDVGTLQVHARRVASDTGAPLVCESPESAWYREVSHAPGRCKRYKSRCAGSTRCSDDPRTKTSDSKWQANTRLRRVGARKIASLRIN